MDYSDAVGFAAGSLELPARSVDSQQASEQIQRSGSRSADTALLLIPNKKENSFGLARRTAELALFDCDVQLSKV